MPIGSNDGGNSLKNYSVSQNCSNLSLFKQNFQEVSLFFDQWNNLSSYYVRTIYGTIKYRSIEFMALTFKEI